MADRIETITVKTEITDMEKAFIESRDMFFVSTIDHMGRPTVSYNSGDAGTIGFPSYDGNGMYLSMGNISANPEIGMLFIDFVRPFRMRLQGCAQVTRDPKALAMFKEAELIVAVTCMSSG